MHPVPLLLACSRGAGPRAPGRAPPRCCSAAAAGRRPLRRPAAAGPSCCGRWRRRRGGVLAPPLGRQDVIRILRIRGPAPAAGSRSRCRRARRLAPAGPLAAPAAGGWRRHRGSSSGSGGGGGAGTTLFAAVHHAPFHLQGNRLRAQVNASQHFFAGPGTAAPGGWSTALPTTVGLIITAASCGGVQAGL